jgi:hypothetical protein
MNNLIRYGMVMAERNRYGLGRYIPSEIRSEVRKRCGFGCVICGLALFDYEHFDPDFKDADKHDPLSITLLCMQCNQKRNRRVLSVETVRKANANPICLQQGFSSETFDFGSDPIEVVFAGVTFIDCKSLIHIHGISMLSIAQPESGHGPFRLSGLFSDRDGLTTLRITDNEWIVGADNWDVECCGPQIIIRKAKNDIALSLRSEPPKRLVVEQLDMEFEGVCLRGKGDVLEFSNNNKRSWGRFQDIGMFEGHGISF